MSDALAECGRKAAAGAQATMQPALQSRAEAQRPDGRARRLRAWKT